jgi:hypothetical protein
MFTNAEVAEKLDLFRGGWENKSTSYRPITCNAPRHLVKGIFTKNYLWPLLSGWKKKRRFE